MEAIGTPFQQEVWKRLYEIPFGATCRYKDVALKIDNPSAVRAVGGAIGRNPISIIIPCHRVLGANGTLTGFAGGLDRKKILLGSRISFLDRLWEIFLLSQRSSSNETQRGCEKIRIPPILYGFLVVFKSLGLLAIARAYGKRPKFLKATKRQKKRCGFLFFTASENSR